MLSGIILAPQSDPARCTAMRLFEVLLFLPFGHSLSLDLGDFDATQDGSCPVDLVPFGDNGEYSSKVQGQTKPPSPKKVSRVGHT